MFRTVQSQSRIITLFAHDLQINKLGCKILNYLKSDTTNNFTVELSNRFPTQDQLKYMKQFDTYGVLGQQIKSLDKLLTLPSFDSVYGSTLSECIESGIWDPKTSLWVDWEKQKLGNTVKSVREYLTALEKEKTAE